MTKDENEKRLRVAWVEEKMVNGRQAGEKKDEKAE